MPRVLVVEDFIPVAHGIARAMRHAGYEVDVAIDCAEAKRNQGWYDAAIVDMELPDGSGLDVANTLRIDGHVDEIVFFTACRDSNLLHQAAQMGKVIDKAAGIAKLVAMLKEWLAVGARRRVAVGEELTTTEEPRSASQRSGARRIRR